MLRLTSFVSLILISGTLCVVAIGCSSDKQTRHELTLANRGDAANNTPHSSVEPLPVAIAPKPEKSASKPNQYDLALDKADGATSIGESAQSADDWQLVASQWQEAIALMQTLPNNSPYKGIAKSKIAQYQRQLIHAQQQARSSQQHPPTPIVIIPESPSPESTAPAADNQVSPPPIIPPDQVVFQAAIKHRVSGTPVIDVNFNGTHTVEMIVDTGASGTVLTQQTASDLGIMPVSTTKANTASAKAVEFPIGYVNSIDVGGATVKDIPVAIAPNSVLDTGLLGHDFFGNYDVTIKRDVVEFRPRS